MLMPQGSIGPDCISLLATYLDLLQPEGVFLLFQRKDEAKTFPAELLPIPRTPVPYLSSHVAKMSTPILSHWKPRNNFTDDIIPPFR